VANCSNRERCGPSSLAAGPGEDWVATSGYSFFSVLQLKIGDLKRQFLLARPATACEHQLTPFAITPCQRVTATTK
jgi:hypothetical protein